MLIPTKKNIATVTDLRTRTIDLLKEVEKEGIKFIYHRNKPCGVLISIDEYQRLINKIEKIKDTMLARELSKESLEEIRNLR